MTEQAIDTKQVTWGELYENVSPPNATADDMVTFIDELPAKTFPIMPQIPLCSPTRESMFTGIQTPKRNHNLFDASGS